MQDRQPHRHPRHHHRLLLALESAMGVAAVVEAEAWVMVCITWAQWACMQLGSEGGPTRGERTMFF
jgi:hypothetical protein